MPSCSDSVAVAPAAQTLSPPHPLLRLHRCSRCNSVTVPPPLCRPQQSLVNRGRRPKQRPRSSPLQPLVAVAIAPRYFSSKSLLSYFSSPSMYLLQDTIRNIPGWRSAVMDLDAKRWPDAQTDDTLSFSKLVRLSFSGFIKGIEESETMVYFVDGSSFRKKGFGSRKPAMAVPDLLKEVGGERCSAFQLKAPTEDPLRPQVDNTFALPSHTLRSRRRRTDLLSLAIAAAANEQIQPPSPSPLPTNRSSPRRHHRGGAWRTYHRSFQRTRIGDGWVNNSRGMICRMGRGLYAWDRIGSVMAIGAVGKVGDVLPREAEALAVREALS
nr:hypothetical protein Iba_chr03cCG3980 [Ipomoea batatas]